MPILSAECSTKCTLTPLPSALIAGRRQEESHLKVTAQSDHVELQVIQARESAINVLADIFGCCCHQQT